MKYVIINDKKYELLKNYKDGYDYDESSNRITDYFDTYDYIVGDWAYGKLRLKGFCKKENKIFNELNDFSKLDEYIKNNCAYECRYFVLERIKEVEDAKN